MTWESDRECLQHLGNALTKPRAKHYVESQDVKAIRARARASPPQERRALWKQVTKAAAADRRRWATQMIQEATQGDWTSRRTALTPPDQSNLEQQPDSSGSLGSASD